MQGKINTLVTMKTSGVSRSELVRGGIVVYQRTFSEK